MTEPKVKTAEVRRVIIETLGVPYEKEAVVVLAERADVSPRTVYRVLEVRRPLLSLEQADRLLTAIGAPLEPAMLEWV